MDRLKKSMNRFIIYIGISVAISLVTVPSCYAQSATELLLAQILATSQTILNKINQLPAYIQDITQMAQSWNTTKDDNNVIGNNQAGFATLSNTDATAISQQIALSQEFTKAFLTAGSTSMPFNSYELGYSVLLNQPISPVPGENANDRQQKLEEAKKNYLKYISGSDILFKQAQNGWNDDTKKQYQGIYNTAASISSYSAFLLSGLYTNQTKETTRTNLVHQATSSSWFTQVATESLGLVLRHILMYTSQSYVELSHISKAQQDQLAIQAMTNSLLVLYANYAVAQSVSAMASMQQQQQLHQQQK
jgi:hypothetical protein